ncbi:MAG: PIG-L family deacetylase [Verrucomicrobia bacterium]|nr:PIG-L family deacetylase [Verrucomicrobiota bacterium]
MKFGKQNADAYTPDGSDAETALKRTTHIGIGAHQDDIEIMSLHGILQCFGRRDKWFTSITCTDGAGSPRAGIYADYTDDEMKQVRFEEQRAAAKIGRYSAAIQLGYTSKEVKAVPAAGLESDLLACLKLARPDVIYVHNPADKHPTHVACMIASLNAMRKLAPEDQPDRVYGVEVWRDLDWLPESRKVVLDVSGRDALAAALIGVYDSQVAGGKRYDIASAGRRAANACYLDSHAVDTCQSAIYAMDLTPLVKDRKADLVEYISTILNEFTNAVHQQLKALTKR